MKVQKHAISLACLAAMGFAGSAQAVQVAGEALEIVGNLYPQYQMSSFGDGSTGAQSTMSTINGTANGAGKPPATSVNWVGSYIGFKSQKSFGDVRMGVNVESVVMKDDTANGGRTDAALGDGRDVFAFIESNQLGRLQLGQMDTIFKEFGDRVRILGISSGNFSSTSSGVALNPSFKSAATGQGSTSFNTRINNQVRWLSPVWNGVQVGITQKPDASRTQTQDQSLQAVGVRWSNPTYYVGLATEVHNDYKVVSGTNNVGGPAIGTAGSPRSKDTAVRLTFGYTAANFRLGADAATLKYTEDSATAGRFASYDTTTYQVSAEYKVTGNVTIGGNFAVGGAGNCALVGGATCTTDGMGGSMWTFGARYDFDQNMGFYGLVGQLNPGSGGTYGSTSAGNPSPISTIGGSVTNVAVGLQVKF